MSKRRWAVFAIVLASVLGLIAGPAVARRVRAAQFLTALSNAPKPGAPDARRLERGVVERDLVFGSDAQRIRARLYSPADGRRAEGLVIAHGIHYRGIDEARLVPFVRAVAATGRVVLTPELRDLTDYRITPQGTDVIAASVQWLSTRDELLADPRVGVLGFSFAGGLALVAASRPELEGRVAFVSSVGGHHDLARVLAFLVSDRIETPSGTRPSKAHEYGLVVLLYQYLDAFVEEPDRAVMADALRLWLHEDRAGARARASERTTLRGEQLFMLLEAGRLKELAPELKRLLATEGDKLHALSPRGKLRQLRVPVYLLHGSGDSVIPASETEWANLELEGRPHYALVSPLLEHVEVNGKAGVLDELALVEFMARIL